MPLSILGSIGVALGGILGGGTGGGSGGGGTGGGGTGGGGSGGGATLGTEVSIGGLTLDLGNLLGLGSGADLDDVLDWLPNGNAVIDTDDGDITLLPLVGGGVVLSLDGGATGITLLPKVGGGVTVGGNTSGLGLSVLPDAGGGIVLSIGEGLPDMDGDPANGPNGANNPGTSGVGSAGWTPGSGKALDLDVAFQNITRIDPDSSKMSASAASALTDIKAKVAAGSLTTEAAVKLFIDIADSTTSVAITTYQFFTGETTTAYGTDYLTNAPDNINKNDLTDDYYANFNAENRYINFAANLAIEGVGRAAFIENYGSLTFEQVVNKAYDEIFNKAKVAASGIDPNAGIADIISRRAYFETVATNRIAAADHDLGVKAGVIGYMLGVAIKSNIGSYSEALEHFYQDVADGQARFNVDLVGVYDGNSWASTTA